MGIEAQIISAIVGAKQASNQAKIAQQQAVVARKTAKNEQLTEGYNSAQRQRDRIAKYRSSAASNVAKGGASGVDTFSGSSLDINRQAAGNLKTANYEDVFATKNKRDALTEAGDFKAKAYQAEASGAKTKALTSLLNTGKSVYNDTDGFKKW